MAIIEILGTTVGIIGMILIVIAYYLAQIERIKPSDLIFININTLGSCCLLFSLLIHFNLASFILELVWISIGILGYIKYFKNKNETKR